MTTKNGIVCEGIWHSWDNGASEEEVVLRDVSLVVKEGEFVSFVGPSGCGKTTLLNVISGLIRPMRGRVLKDGALVLGPDKDLGFVFQDYSLFPWLSVEKNVAFGLRLNGRSRRDVDEVVSRILLRVGLWDARKKYPYQLSGGMKQRTAIARVLANDARYLLMDEPFGALDYQTRLNMQHFLADICEEFQKTVLFVTHSVEEAVVLSDRVYLMPGHRGYTIDHFAIDLPKPREITDEKFNQYRKYIIDHLNREVISNSIEYSHGTTRGITAL